MHLTHQLVHKHRYAINKRGYKNSFRCFVPVRVNVDGKENGIGEQRDAADGCQQLFVSMQYVKIFTDADGAAENPVIINGHRDERAKYAQENTDF
jgi:hypothetical protein